MLECRISSCSLNVSIRSAQRKPNDRRKSWHEAYLTTSRARFPVALFSFNFVSRSTDHVGRLANHANGVTNVIRHLDLAVALGR